MHTALFLHLLRPKVLEHLHVEIDRTVPNVSSAKIGDEGFSQIVKERTSKQDRDARGTG